MKPFVNERAAQLPIAPESRWTRARRVLRGVLLAAVSLAVLFHLWIVAQLWWWRTHNPGSTAFMKAGLERLQAKNARARLQHVWVPYAKISTHLKRAVIAAEDQKFLEHEGFDWEEIEKAYARNERRGRVVRGASTISQQLAKNLFLSGWRSYLRKAEEALLTLLIEQMWSKRRILEIYLNVIEWGNGVYGAEAAARHYFGVSAAQLDEEQAARLAAMIPNPRYFDRRRDSPYLARRTEELRRYMPLIAIP